MRSRLLSIVAAACVGVSLAAAVACSKSAPTPTVDDATKFVNTVNETMLTLETTANQARWVSENFITGDTEAIDAHDNQRFTDTIATFAKEAVKFDHVDVPSDIRRQLNLIKLSLVLATPSDPTASAELTTIAARLDGMYGKGKWCPDSQKPDACKDLGQITTILATSRDERELRGAWDGWRTIAQPMRKPYARLVDLSNEGAKALGFADTGAMWRSTYDMPPDDFTKELDRLWTQVRPLYLKLHAYVRMKLHEKYGDVVPVDGPIPADLLGSIWAQDWTNIYPLVAPAGADPGYSLTDILRKRNVSAVDMVKMGERFYVSLGFAPLPQTFWQRSLFTEPRDRDVVCQPSAWDIDLTNDLRVKMCMTPTAADFTAIHRELGQNVYQRAYDALPVLFRDSANDGFREAVGDTMALSVTPEYLVRIGLLDSAPDQSRDVGLLLNTALEKIAFLPFGLLVDEWRWQVFSGQIAPADYNKAWWALRLKYQGVAPPDVRGEESFDPGAEYHVPGNVPYAGYFLADILGFQFHRALAKVAGCTTPLDRCSIYDNKEAGERLSAMLSMGRSRPWPDALEALTGSRQMDATALLSYFAPLEAWLDEQVKGKTVGW